MAYIVHIIFDGVMEDRSAADIQEARKLLDEANGSKDPPPKGSALIIVDAEPVKTGAARPGRRIVARWDGSPKGWERTLGS